MSRPPRSHRAPAARHRTAAEARELLQTAGSARLIRLAVAGRAGARVLILWLVAENDHLPGPARGKTYRARRDTRRGCDKWAL